MKKILQHSRSALFLSVCLMVCSSSLLAAVDDAVYEQDLLAILDVVRSGDLEQALTAVNAHLVSFPNSKSGLIIKADIISAMSGVVEEAGASAAIMSQPELPALVEGYKKQLASRWIHVNKHAEQHHTLLPDSLLHMGEHKHVLVADMANGRLYLYANNDGTPSLVKDYYLTVGSKGYGKQTEGDNKTPIGLYEINKYIDDKELPDLYGKGAFPVNYPNKLDRYRKRSGYGIWLHGTPSNTFARTPWASEGCFVLSNADFVDISEYLSAEHRTPVILADEVNWVSLQQLEEKRTNFLQIVKQWQQDWESLDTQSYLQHYKQQDFNFGQQSFSGWAKQKKQVNRAKTFVQVDTDIKSLFQYPGEKDMFVVRYKQRYLSNNFKSESDKEQYWQLNDQGNWQIIYEG